MFSIIVFILSLQHQNTEERSVENTERRRTAIRSVVEMGYSQSVVQACVDRLVERGNYVINESSVFEPLKLYFVISLTFKINEISVDAEETAHDEPLHKCLKSR